MIKPWQEILTERLPSDAEITFGEEGGAVTATFGHWRVQRGFACHWIDITGPGIYDRIAIAVDYSGQQWNRALTVLEALGAPIRPGRPLPGPFA